MSTYILAFLLANISVVIGGRPVVKCPVPVSPLDGQSFIAKSGTTVTYTCNPGFKLEGTKYSFCEDGHWYPKTPFCAISESSADKVKASIPLPITTPRPLFKWNSDIKTTRHGNALIQKDDSQTLYVKRWPYYRAPLQPVVTNRDKVQARKDSLHYHRYPKNAFADYRISDFSNSHLPWMNNDHPEIRDKYFGDLQNIRVINANFLNHKKDHQSVVDDPYCIHQPVTENLLIATLDYSCHRQEKDGKIKSITAPNIPNGHVYRYSRRRNENYPYNDYLVAEYCCGAGYALLNPKDNELYCSQSRWIGHHPVCIS